MQHCPEGATHTKGPPQSAMDMRAMPPAPAAPTSPSPPRIGAMPAVPSPAAAASPTTLPAIPKSPPFFIDKENRTMLHQDKNELVLTNSLDFVFWTLISYMTELIRFLHL